MLCSAKAHPTEFGCAKLSPVFNLELPMRCIARAFLSLVLISTATLSHAEFMPIQANASTGKVLLDIPAWNQPFLMVATLENALGSNDIGLDRAQNGDPLLVEFRRIGQKAFLVQRNTRFVANSADADEAKAARDAFAEAVLWSGTLQAGAVNRVEINSLLLTDWVGFSNRLQSTKQGSYRLDAERSSVLPDEAHSFPDNSDFTALLTFSGSGEGQFVQQVAADSQALSIKQRISFVRLPSAGYLPRSFHPASGAYSISHYDFAQAINNNIEVRQQPRFRLQKTDPTAARSTVVKPIVFYLDRGTPEPIRSALLEGANWWGTAFEQAGFIGGFRAELAPPGMSMSDVRYNTITWTHRATRGWSYGGGLIDPRTGEIIKGYVNLGSQRVRQDLLIAEGLLAPYRPGADPALLNEAQHMALQRLKQLAAHEVGHALGFAHNFAASRTATGSVLDYPHPQVSLASDGRPRMPKAYDIGVGEWDNFVVEHGYAVFAPQNEATELAKLRAAIKAKGYEYVSDGDARSLNNSHEAGVLWDLPGDAMQGLQQLLRVRESALQHFAEGALPPDRQVGDAERRLVPIYLLHRYQSEAVVRLLGGSDYAYGLVADANANANNTPVNGDMQHKALAVVAQLLSEQTLNLPDSVLRVMSPPSNEYSRNKEYFGSKMEPLFDPMQAVASASALIAQMSFDSARLNRLAWQHDRDKSIPSVNEVFQTLLTQPWQQRGPLILSTRNWTLLDAALLTLDSGNLHPAVAAQWRSALGELAKQLTGSKDADQNEAGRYIQRYLADPSSVKLRPLATIPPGSPI